MWYSMVFIIAEIGINWDGDKKLAEEMIIEAKNAGCSAVKFQSFTEELVKGHPEKSRLMKSSITQYNIGEISDIAKSNNIEWFCTPMHPEAVEMINPFVTKFKIREYDSRSILNGTNNKIFEEILKTNKEIFMSCNKSPKSLQCYGDPKIKYLYCVPKYPCSLNELEFKNLNEYDGYSNHCNHLLAPLIAAFLGANIIEIHLTSNKSKNFIDNNVSFDYNELKNCLNLISDLKDIDLD